MLENTLKPTLLIVDDDPDFLKSICNGLSREFDTISAESGAEALRRLSPPPDLALVDVRLNEDDPQDQGGILLLDQIRQELPHLPVVMATAHGDVDVAVECIRRGAVDFLQKHRSSILEISSRLNLVLRHARELRDNEDLRKQVEGREIVGVSTHIQEVKKFINAAARNEVTVLITGEPGTGKELVARAIHANGPRASAPFVALSLVARPPEVVDSELFGHEKGAFTDARERRIGRMESAHKGVLFLDEIGEISLDIQKKLLRVLEEREFERIGGNTTIRVDLQLVTATNADLSKKVKDQLFKSDLYHRLQVFEIHLQPLRQHREDIPALVEHYLASFTARGRRIGAVSPEAFELLKRRDWPGNVRQLKNALESAQIHAEIRGHGRIEAADLPVEAGEETSPAGQPGDAGFNVDEALARQELLYIRKALESSGGEIAGACRMLGYHDRFVLGRRLKMIRAHHPSLQSEFADILARNAPAPRAGLRKHPKTAGGRH